MKNNGNPAKKKDLLTEATIRRFMKLANIPVVGNGRRSLLREEVEEEEDKHKEPDDDETPPVPDADMPPIEDETSLDTPPAVGGEPSLEGVDQDKVEQLVNAIADAITEVTGVSVDVNGNEKTESGSETPEMPEPKPEGEVPPMPDNEEGSEEPKPEEEKPLEEGKELVNDSPKKVDGSHKDHEMKPAKNIPKGAMVNEIVNRVTDKVYTKLLEQLKKDKVIPEKPASPAPKK